jgi:hypothetical protein
MLFVANNINLQITKYKDEYRDYEKNVENELILICLQNSGDVIMRQQLNFITYAGTI